MKVVPPKEDADATVRRGIQRRKHVQPSLVQNHAPNLSDFHAGPAVLTSHWQHITRKLSAQVNMPRRHCAP